MNPFNIPFEFTWITYFLFGSLFGLYVYLRNFKDNMTHVKLYWENRGQLVFLAELVGFPLIMIAFSAICWPFMILLVLAERAPVIGLSGIAILVLWATDLFNNVAAWIAVVTGLLILAALEWNHRQNWVATGDDIFPFRRK